MAVQKQIRFLMILTAGMPIFFFNMFLCNDDMFWHRIAAAPPFSELRRFPQGRGFKQWTGDDSKALMKVCEYIFQVGKIATYQRLGISSCYRKLHTPWGLAYISCFSGVLLHCSAGYHHWGNASRANWCSQSLSSVLCYLCRAWHSSQWILTSKATLPCSLSRSNSGIWCPQWFVFLHHRI